MINPYAIAAAWFAMGVVVGVCAFVVIATGLHRRPRAPPCQIVNLAEWKERRRA